MFGTPEQQDQWLRPLLEGEIRSAFAMTEPDVASSDATNISLRIEADGDDYVLNGRKWWISGAMHPNCAIFIVMGKTDPEASPHRQQSQILVPKDTPGLTVKRALPVFGYMDQEGHVELEFDNVRAGVQPHRRRGRRVRDQPGATRARPDPPLHARHRRRRAGLELLCQRALSHDLRPAHRRAVQHQDWIADARIELEMVRLRQDGMADGHGREQGRGGRDQRHQGGGAERGPKDHRPCHPGPRRRRHERRLPAGLHVRAPADAAPRRRTRRGPQDDDRSLRATTPTSAWTPSRCSSRAAGTRRADSGERTASANASGGRRPPRPEPVNTAATDGLVQTRSTSPRWRGPAGADEHAHRDGIEIADPVEVYDNLLASVLADEPPYLFVQLWQRGEVRLAVQAQHRDALDDRGADAEVHGGRDATGRAEARAVATAGASLMARLASRRWPEGHVTDQPADERDIGRGAVADGHVTTSPCAPPTARRPASRRTARGGGHRAAWAGPGDRSGTGALAWTTATWSPTTSPTWTRARSSKARIGRQSANSSAAWPRSPSCAEPPSHSGRDLVEDAVQQCPDAAGTAARGGPRHQEQRRAPPPAAPARTRWWPGRDRRGRGARRGFG